jgi:hypothetical protein
MCIEEDKYIVYEYKSAYSIIILKISKQPGASLAPTCVSCLYCNRRSLL